MVILWGVSRRFRRTGACHFADCRRQLNEKVASNASSWMSTLSSNSFRRVHIPYSKEVCCAKGCSGPYMAYSGLILFQRIPFSESQAKFMDTTCNCNRYCAQTLSGHSICLAMKRNELRKLYASNNKPTISRSDGFANAQCMGPVLESKRSDMFVSLTKLCHIH